MNSIRFTLVNWDLLKLFQLVPWVSWNLRWVYPSSTHLWHDLPILRHFSSGFGNILLDLISFSFKKGKNRWIFYWKKKRFDDFFLSITEKLIDFVRSQQLKHIDFSFVILLMTILVGASNLFLWCFFGKLATDSFKEMTDCLYECNWQDFPIDLQKYFILMIANSQRPLFYRGSRIATLNLETYSKVWISFFRNSDLSSVLKWNVSNYDFNTTWSMIFRVWISDDEDRFFLLHDVQNLDWVNVKRQLDAMN